MKSWRTYKKEKMNVKLFLIIKNKIKWLKFRKFAKLTVPLSSINRNPGGPTRKTKKNKKRYLTFLLKKKEKKRKFLIENLPTFLIDNLPNLKKKRNVRKRFR